MAVINKIARWGFRLLIAILLLFLIVWGGIRIPAVQNYLVQMATTQLSQKLQTKVSVGRVDIEFIKTAVIKEVYVEDRQNDTLLFAGKLAVDIGLFSLLDKKLHLNSLELRDTRFKLYNVPDSNTLNLQFVIDAFSGKKKKDPEKKGSPWAISVSAVELDQVQFSLQNESIDVKTGIRNGLIEMHQLDLIGKQIKIKVIDLEGAEAIITQLKKKTEEDVVTPSVKAEASESSNSFPFADWVIQADKLKLEDSRAVIWNNNASLQDIGMDYMHMDYSEASILIEDYFWNDTIMRASLRRASLKERSGVELKELQANVSMSPTFIKAENLIAKTGASEIHNNTILRFPDFSDLSDYLNTVKMESRFENTTVAIKELEYFVPGWERFPVINTQLDEVAQLSGTVQTRNDAVTVKEMALVVGNDLDLVLNGRIGQLQGNGVFDLDIQRLVTSSRGLQRFTKGIPTPESLGDIHFQSKITGNYDSLHLGQTILETSGATGFLGNLIFKELSGSVFKFQAEAEELAVEWPVIEELADQDLPALFDSLGLIRFQGEIGGDPLNIDVDGRFETDAGWMTGPIQMNFEEDYSSAQYKGDIELNDFDLSKLAGSGLGKTTTCVQFTGVGFQPEEMALQWELQIDSIEQGSYTYQDIFMFGSIDFGELIMEVLVLDPNLQIQFEAEGCPLDPEPEISAHVNIDSVDIQALGFIDFPIDVHGEIAIDLKGSEVDRHNFYLSATDLIIQNDSLTHITPTLIAKSTFSAEHDHQINIQSNFLNAHFDGHYLVSNIDELTEAVIDHYFPVEGMDELIEPDTVLDRLLEESFVKFEINLENADTLFSILLPGLENLSAATFVGDLQGKERKFQIDATLPTLNYKGTRLDSLTLHVRGDSNVLNSKLGLAAVTSGTLTIPPAILESRIVNEKLAFDFNIDQDEGDKLVGLGGDIWYEAPFYRLTLDEQLITNNNQWNIPKGNELSWKKSLLLIRDLTLQRGEQQLGINTLTVNNKEVQPPLEVKLSGFRLGELVSSFLEEGMVPKGLANGNVQIFNFDKDPFYRGNIQIDSLALGEKHLGNLKARVEQPENEEFLDMELSLKGPDNDLEITGAYQLDQNSIGLDLEIKKMEAGIIEVFATNQLDQTKGQVSGKLSLTGELQQPLLLGELTVEDVTTRVVISNTVYQVNDHHLKFEKNYIDLGRFQVKEANGRQSEIWGSVSHQYFRDIALDLNFQTNEFQVLNTTKKDNDLFYGNLFISANGRLSGPINRLKLVTGAKTLPGSDLTILAYGTEQEIQQENYIVFGNPYREGANANGEDDRLLSKLDYGFAVEANLEITPAMKLNILLDPDSGDRLECAGQANIAVKVNSKGKLDILGDYVFDRGSYYFSYEGLVKKEFLIQNGSQLIFLGNPYDTRFDITAVYSTKTAIFSLVQGKAVLTDEETRRAQKPTNVFLDLMIRGNLDNPELSFGIRVPDPGDGAIKNAVDWQLAELNQRPNELNTQVFSVMFFNSFIPPDGSGGGDNLAGVAETAAFSSLRGFTTNQLNKFADQLVKGVEISFDIDSYTSGTIENGSTEIITEMGVKVSKSLFHDRLSIEVGSNVNVKRQDAMSFNTSDFSGIAGDFVLEYKLNEQGNYLVKVYHLNEYDILYDGTDYKTGISFVLRRKLGKKAREERRKRKAENAIKKEEKKQKKKQTD